MTAAPSPSPHRRFVQGLCEFRGAPRPPAAIRADRMSERLAEEARSRVDPASSRPLRIALLSYRSDPRVGGQGVFVSHVAEALALRGHNVDVISGPPYPELSAGVRLVRLPSLDLYAQPDHGHYALRPRHLLSWADTAEYFGHLSGQFTEPYSFGRRAAAYLRSRVRDYDVALDNQTLCYGLIDIARAGLPVVEVIHHPIRRDLEFALAAESEWGRRLLLRRWYGFLAMQERVAPRLQSAVTVSKASADDIVRYLGVAAEAITVVPLGVDQTLFRSRPEITRAPAQILTTASADTPLKGLPVLIAAYAKLLNAHPGLELLVIGKLRVTGRTAEQLAGLQADARVRFVSDLSGEEMAQAYARATLCVTPSLYEGFGLPAAEAMACAASVVVSDGGALPEVVGEAGVVVPRGDADALARAIGALLDDPARREALGAAGLARAQARYSWARVGEAYEAVLRRAAAVRRDGVRC